MLLGTCIGGFAWGLHVGHGFLAFNILYFCLAIALLVIERVLPHERQWLGNDGQMPADLAHTLLGKGTAQILVASATLLGIAAATKSGGPWWPGGWPLAAQVVLGLVIAEAGLYAAHRLAHEWRPLWRFHAVHHSAPRLWFFNTGRFHAFDTVVSILASQPLLWLAGAPQEVFMSVAAITAFIGMLTHCNVDMKCGWLSYVFNTPELHRWHHSRIPAEGNTNFGENLMLFDQIFGTFFWPAHRRPPADIGIDGPMPDNFLGQLAQPFRRT